MNELLLILLSVAPTQDGAPAGGMLGTMMPLILIFVIFYFLLIRPQQKKAKEHQKFLDSIEKGMEVITNGGMIGKVTGITRSIVTLEIAQKVKIKILRSAISGKAPQGGDETESGS